MAQAAGRATRNYIAIDLGATSGRAVLGRFDGARLELEELYRFANGPVERNGALHWDLPRMLREVENSLTKAMTKGQPTSVACDTWALDHGFLDADGRILELPYCYQDGRTQAVAPQLARQIPKQHLFRRTSSPYITISTLHQLLATRQERPDLLERAERMLFMPDLVHHHLCGESATEFCIASTSQLCAWEQRSWDMELARELGLPERILPPLRPCGTELGKVKEGIARRTGLERIPVHLTAGHDTAAAFMAAPRRDDFDLVMSSGTWAMLGIATARPIVTREACEAGFGNYGLPGNGWVFINGIMGLYLMERLRREERLAEAARLADEAEHTPELAWLFDPADASLTGEGRFLALLRAVAERGGETMPDSATARPGQVVRAILESLALYVAETVGQFEALAGRPIRRIIVVGGGSKNRLLNRMIANACNRPLVTGHPEATAAGNILVQAVGRGELGSFDEIAEIAKRSWHGETFEPRDATAWELARARFAAIRERSRVTLSTP